MGTNCVTFEVIIKSHFHLFYLLIDIFVLILCIDVFLNMNLSYVYASNTHVTLFSVHLFFDIRL